jgi:hypothetical protein
MVVPILIFVVCFAGGAYAAAQWLPALGTGRVAGLSFFAVCGLLAAALGNAGLNIYSIIRELGNHVDGFGGSNADFVASGLRILLLEAGTLFGLAAIVYLLAPQTDRERPAAGAAAAETDLLP